MLRDPVREQSKKLADKDLFYMQRREQDKARAEVAAWRKNLLRMCVPITSGVETSVSAAWSTIVCRLS